MTLPIYIAIQYLRSLGIVGIFVIALIYLIDSIDRYQLHSRDQPEIGQILLYTATRLPLIVMQFFPLVILIASLTTFLRLARDSELVILRAAGIAAMRTVFVPLFVTLILGIVSITMINPFVVGANSLSASLEDQLKGRDNAVIRLVEDGVWLREVIEDEARIIGITKVDWREEQFSDLEIFRLRPDAPREHVMAKTAKLENGQWVLKDGEVIVDGEPISRAKFDELLLPTSQKFSSFLEVLAPIRQINNYQILEHIRMLERDGYDSRAARSHFYDQLALPLFYGAICLIGAVFALSPMRGGGTGVRVVSSLAAGFTFYAFAQLSRTLGEAGELPFFISAFALPIAAIFFALAVLLHLEDG